jgi:serine/threonine protein kinase
VRVDGEPEPGRHVALKVLPPHGRVNPTLLHRFRLEARAAARLHHTNVVPVYGVGESGGVHHYAMPFIQGQGLDAILREVAHRRRGGSAAAAPGLCGARASAVEADQTCSAAPLTEAVA